MPETKDGPDCENCLFRSERWRDGGYCYMFRNDPPDYCASERPVNQASFPDKNNQEIKP